MLTLSRSWMPCTYVVPSKACQTEACSHCADRRFYRIDHQKMSVTPMWHPRAKRVPEQRHRHSRTAFGQWPWDRKKRLARREGAHAWFMHVFEGFQLLVPSHLTCMWLAFMFIRKKPVDKESGTNSLRKHLSLCVVYLMLVHLQLLCFQRASCFKLNVYVVSMFVRDSTCLKARPLNSNVSNHEE